jgi:hypothetical protein
MERQRFAALINFADGSLASQVRRRENLSGQS